MNCAKRFSREEKLPKRTVAISFDDGWRDNYRFALPILRKHELPATVFLATSYISTENTFWTDAIGQAVGKLRSADLQEALSKNSLPVPKAAVLLPRLISAEQTEAANLLDTLICILKQEPEENRSAFAEKLVELSGDSGGKRVFLNWDEVEEMAQHRIEFGAHTHSHRPLTELDADEARSEVRTSLELLRQRKLPVSPAFCYPEGAHSEQTQRLLAEEGISCALSTAKQTDSETEPVLLGRIGIHDDISSTVPLFAARIWASEIF